MVRRNHDVGGLMYSVDYDNNGKIYAYNLTSKLRDASKDFNILVDVGNNFPRGIWSDGIHDVGELIIVFIIIIMAYMPIIWKVKQGMLLKTLIH